MESRQKLRLASVPPSAPVRPLTIDEAYERYASYVAAIGHKLLGSRADVDDLIQDVFIHAMSGLATINDPAATKAWLATVTVRVARRKLRKRRLLQFLKLAEPGVAVEPRSATLDPEKSALLGVVYRVLDSLPVEQRIAWVLRHVEGESNERVAMLCGCSLATAKRRIAAAHAYVQKEMGHG